MSEGELHSPPFALVITIARVFTLLREDLGEREPFDSFAQVAP